MAEENMGCEPSKEEIKGGRELVRYELEMLNAAVNMLFDDCRPRGDKKRDPETYLGSAIRDSVLLHARSLYHFFAGNGWKKDIIVDHFGTEEVDKLRTSSRFDCNRERVNQHIDNISKFRAHLTYKRLARHDTKWTDDKIREIRNSINAMFDEFVACLPDSERSHWEIPDLKEKGKGYFKDLKRD